MSRTSSASSSDLPAFPRSLPDIGHLDVRTRQGWQEKWQLAMHHIRSHGFCCKPQAACACLAAEGVTLSLRMNYQLIPKELRWIAEKVEAQQRISEADALRLYQANDLNALGMIANVVRERKTGTYAPYINIRTSNYSNICILSCQFCAFAAKKRDAHAFEYAIDEIVRVVSDALPLG